MGGKASFGVPAKATKGLKGAAWADLQLDQLAWTRRKVERRKHLLLLQSGPGTAAKRPLM